MSGYTSLAEIEREVAETYKRGIRRDRAIIVAASFASSFVGATVTAVLLRFGVFDHILAAVCR